MAEPTTVDRLYDEYSAVLNHLQSSGQLSLIATADDSLRKALLLSVASYFEHRMTDVVLSFVYDASQGNPLVSELVRSKAVSRQYHTWFKWDDKTANQFYGLFGNDFRNHMKRKVAKDPDFDASVRAFLELGNERNRLVHENYGSFTLEKTFQEIYTLYNRALPFVEALPQILREPIEDTRSAAGT